ncbi:MAG TPA: energy transducer TonB [Bacteroidales bacterium]|nr:energy transducer TonB [Bacteroidales bacterium]
MKKKKSEKANLEKNRLIFFEVGLIVTLSLSLIAFEWSKAPSDHDGTAGQRLTAENMEQTEITFRKEPEIKKERPKMTLIINEVDDNNLLIDEPAFFNPEINGGDSYDRWVIPELDPEPTGDPEPFVNVSDKPLFNGGDPMIEFRKYIAMNVRYPQEAIDNGVEGRVIVQFIIDEHGNMTNVQVVQGVHPSLDHEAARVIKSSPAWTPGKQRTRPVRVIYTFPVVFKLSR